MKRILVGFDGFVDHVVRPVATRSDGDHYTLFEHIAPFAKRIEAAAGRSCNIELTPVTTTIGGNAPLMTLALNAQGCHTTLIGCLGEPEVEPLFQPLVEGCEQVVSIASPGITRALEFQDGKVLLGELHPLHAIDFDYLQKYVDLDTLVALFQRSDLIALVNWTMLPGMTAIWEGMLQQIAPRLNDRTGTLFIDLADPAKRGKGELKAAIDHLLRLQPYFNVILGLNRSEADQVLQLTPSSSPAESELELATAIHSHLPLHTIIVHSRHAAAFKTDQQALQLATPLVSSPIRTTGAGDHFNAGYCRAWLETEDPEKALRAAIATASYYVKTGISPGILNLSLESSI